MAHNISNSETQVILVLKRSFLSYLWFRHISEVGLKSHGSLPENASPLAVLVRKGHNKADQLSAGK